MKPEKHRIKHVVIGAGSVVVIAPARRVNHYLLNRHLENPSQPEGEAYARIRGDCRRIGEDMSKLFRSEEQKASVAARKVTVLVQPQ